MGNSLFGMGRRVCRRHSLARVSSLGHDFDVLARELSSKFRVIAPEQLVRAK